MHRLALLLSLSLMACGSGDAGGEGGGANAADAWPATDEACAGVKDGTPCPICDLMGVCMGGVCNRAQIGPPFCR